MFSITVYIAPQPVLLLYKSEEKASQHFVQLTIGADPAEVKDDFGHQFHRPLGAKFPVMFENMDETAIGHIELALHHQRTQAKAQKAAHADPVLAAARALNGQGPSVIQPMGLR